MPQVSILLIITIRRNQKVHRERRHGFSLPVLKLTMFEYNCLSLPWSVDHSIPFVSAFPNLSRWLRPWTDCVTHSCVGATQLKSQEALKELKKKITSTYCTQVLNARINRLNQRVSKSTKKPKQFLRKWVFKQATIVASRSSRITANSPFDSPRLAAPKAPLRWSTSRCKTLVCALRRWHRPKCVRHVTRPQQHHEHDASMQEVLEI